MKFELDPYRTPPAKLTSPPYPVITLDEATIVVAWHKTQFYGWLPLEMTIGASAVSGELRLIFKSYSMAPEGLAPTPSLISYELRQIMKRCAFFPEALALLLAPVSGECKVILIVYQRWFPEALALSISAVSATLT